MFPFNQSKCSVKLPRWPDWAQIDMGWPICNWITLLRGWHWIFVVTYFISLQWSQRFIVFIAVAQWNVLNQVNVLRFVQVVQQFLYKDLSKVVKSSRNIVLLSLRPWTKLPDDMNMHIVEVAMLFHSLY